jgi:tetratricopeptide (TPR) repeat protein
MRSAALLLLFFMAVSATADEWLSGTWILAERTIDAAIARTARAGDRAAEARLLARRAHFLLDRSSYHQLDPERARRAIDEARRAAETSGDRFALAGSIQALGRWQYSRKLSAGSGEWEAIDATFCEALRIREEIGDRAGLSESWFYRGLVQQMQEKLEPARKAFEQALRFAGDPLARSFALRHLGYVLEVGGENAAARRAYEQSLELRRQAGAHALVPFAIQLVADFALEAGGDRAAAIELLRESARVARCAKSWRALHAAEGKLAVLEGDENRLARAREHARRALDAAVRYGDAELIADARRKAAALAGHSR